jgi:polar amino acid transport system substrate-binding protein
MLKRLFLAALAFSLALAGAKPSVAETVVEKAARTGILTVGTRFDLVPYSYVNDQGDLDGYSLNIVNLVKEELQRQLGRDITLQVVETKDVTETIPLLLTGEIDITCSTVFTWERDEYVDFSVSYAVSGVRLLVAKDSDLGTPESLANKRVAVITKSTADDTIKVIQPQATLVGVDSFEAGIEALKAGKVDAVAGDTVILDGLRQKMGAGDYKLTPDAPYARYGIACMVPENNSTFLNITNHTIVKFMQGYLVGAEGPTNMLNRWIGPKGIVTVVSPEAVREFFEHTIITREQIPLPESESDSPAQQ